MDLLNFLLAPHEQSFHGASDKPSQRSSERSFGKESQQSLQQPSQQPLQQPLQQSSQQHTHQYSQHSPGQAHQQHNLIKVLNVDHSYRAQDGEIATGTQMLGHEQQQSSDFGQPEPIQQQSSHPSLKMSPERVKLLEALAVNPSALAALMKQGLVSDEEPAFVALCGVGHATADNADIPHTAQSAAEGTVPDFDSPRFDSPASMGERNDRAEGSCENLNQSKVGSERYTYQRSDRREIERPAPVRPREQIGGYSQDDWESIKTTPTKSSRQCNQYVSKPYHAYTGTTPTGPRQQNDMTPDLWRPPSASRRSICFFWYHFGHCNKHPQSDNYNGSYALCPYLHFLDRNTEYVPMQSIPWKFHMGIGDCRLDRCPFSSTYINFQKASTGWRVREVDSRERRMESPPRSATRQQLSTPALNSPSKPVSTTDSTASQRKKGKKSKSEVKDAQSPITLKRKATLPPPTIPTTSRKKQKHKCGPKAPSSTPSVLSTFVDLKPNSSKAVTANTVKETCFFWYHDDCLKTGPRCDRVHALTNPPKFIQPPRGYVHREKCFREWCPGDWLWDHSGRGDGGKDDSRDEESEEEEAQLDYDEDGDKERDDEWLVQGFPDV